MRNYGFNKATEFTKKQINVLYRLAKEGTLKIQKGTVNRFYSLADYYGMDWNKSIVDDEQTILLILDATFKEDYETAQSWIDFFTEQHYKLLSNKMKDEWNTELV